MKKLVFIGLCALSVVNCSSYDFKQSIVQQGNLLPEDKIKRLKKGMSKRQVAQLMGTSLLNPLFNRDRWDYAYTWRKGFKHPQQKHVVLYFTNARLSKIKT